MPASRRHPKPFLDGAPRYANAGWRYPLPVDGKGETPAGFTGYKRPMIVPPDRMGYWLRHRGGHNVTLALPVDMVGLDLDYYKDAPQEVKDEAVAFLAKLPQTFVSSSRFGPDWDGHSGIRLFRLPAEMVELAEKPVWKGNLFTVIDLVRFAHRQVVCWPSVHHSGRTYEWLDESTGEVLTGGSIPSPTDIPEMPIDLARMLLKEPPAPKAPRTRKKAPPVTVDPMLLDDADWCPAIARVMKEAHDGVAAGGPRHDGVALSAVMRVTRLGEQGHVGADWALEALHEFFIEQAGEDREDEWVRAVDGAMAAVESEPTDEADKGCCTTKSAGRNEWQVKNTADLKDEAVDRIGTGPTSGLFMREGRMTHVPTIGQEGYRPVPVEEGEDGPAQVWEVSENLLGHVIEQAYWLYREKKIKDDDGNEVVVKEHVMMPAAILKRLLGASHMMPNLRHLAGVVHTPLMRPDGTLLTEAGYDGTTRLLYLPDAEVEVPSRPTPVQVLAAREVVQAVIGDFPWKHEGDKANYLAALTLPFLRLVVPPPWPMWMLNAHQPGSGKTMLSRILRFTHGGVQRSALPKDEDEIRKQLTSVLLATGGQVVVWDNVMGLVKSAELAGLLTSKTRTDRRLGASEDVTVTNDRLFAMTGNNLSIGGDLPRRVVWVSIDPKMPNPEMRAPSTFKVPDPDLWVRDHLAEFRGALLTLLAAWAADGMKVGKVTRTDDYGRLAAVMEGLLPYVDPTAGRFMDPATSMATVAADDEDWALYLHALFETYGTKPFTCRAVVALPFDHEVTTAQPEDLTAKSTSYTSLTSKTLGMFFRNRDGRWHGDYCLRRGPMDARKTVQWTIERRV